MIRFSLHYCMLFVLMATVFPYFQVFLKARGFSDAEVGFLQGAKALASAFGPILIGHLADRLGQRRVLLGACLIASAALLAPMSLTASFWVAFALMIGMGFALPATIPLTDALASRELPDPTHQYGRVRIWGSIGFVVTLLTIRWLGLVDESSWPWMMTNMLIATGLVLVSSLLLPDRRRTSDIHQPTPGRGSAHFDGVFWLFLLAAAMHQLGMSAYYFFFTNYLREVVRMEHAAWVWAIGSAAEIPVLFLGGRIIRRFGLRSMLVVSMATISTRFVVYALVPDLGAILPIQLLHAGTFGLFHAASIEFLRRKVPAARRALAMTLYTSLAIGLPCWIGSSLGGMLVQHAGYATLYLLYAAAPLIGIALVVAGGKRLELPQRREET